MSNVINDNDRAIGKVIHFNHPEFDIPCVAGWNEEGEVLMFDIEDYDSALGAFSEDTVESVRRWCMRSNANCDSIHRANDHLMFLGIPAQFE